MDKLAGRFPYVGRVDYPFVVKDESIVPFKNVESSVKYNYCIELSSYSKLKLIASLGGAKFLEEFRNKYKNTTESQCKGVLELVEKILFEGKSMTCYAFNKYSIYNLASSLYIKSKTLFDTKQTITLVNGSVRVARYSIQRELSLNYQVIMLELANRLKHLSSEIRFDYCRVYLAVSDKINHQFILDVVSNSEWRFNIVDL